jgi:glyoxylase-like metal-dependent hydrolase (beta-lactamase superfamily II)
VAPDIVQIPVPIPFPMKYVNCYLLLGDGAVLVDCGLDTPEAQGALRGALAEHGLTYADLDQLILTHHHPDHYGLSGIIEGAGVEVGMLDKEYANGHQFWLGLEVQRDKAPQMFRRHGVPDEVMQNLEAIVARQRRTVHPPQRPKTFSHGQHIELAGSTYQAIWTPGHAEGHAALLRESDGVLLAGDHILNRISPNISLWSYSGRPNPLGDYLNSLDVVAELDITLALPGHYDPIQNISQRIGQLKDHHAERLDTLLGLMHSRPQTCWELSLGLFSGNLNPAQRRFAWSETLAHLEYLRFKGEAVVLEGEPMKYALSEQG